MIRIKLPTKIFKQTRNRHLVVWFLVLLKFIFFTSITGTLSSKIVWSATLMLNFSFSYYALLLYIWPSILGEKKIIFLVHLVIVAFAFISIYYIQVEVLIPKIGGKLIWTGEPIGFLVKKFLMNFSFVILASLGSYFNWRGIIQTESELQMKMKIIEAELRGLKSQFHSHLTFNFLNFCYNKFRYFSPDTADSVEEFSKILRYSLDDRHERKVLLMREIEYIETCISFQKCLTNEVFIQFSYTGDVNKVFIIPKILAVFIENALKHGTLDDPEFPVVISIASSCDTISFQIENKKSNQAYQESGVGLQNIEAILNLFYPLRHKLDISSGGDFFSCKLTLNECI